MRQHLTYYNCFVICPQIAVEADELFSGVLTDLGEIIDYNPNGQDPILIILITWRP